MEQEPKITTEEDLKRSQLMHSVFKVLVILFLVGCVVSIPLSMNDENYALMFFFSALYLIPSLFVLGLIIAIPRKSRPVGMAFILASVVMLLLGAGTCFLCAGLLNA